MRKSSSIPWDVWFKPESFTSTIESYLRSQKRVCSAILAKYHYDVLIEFGCGDGSLTMSAAAENEIDYIGIDKSIDAIDRARTLLRGIIDNYSYERIVKYIVGDACSLLDIEFNSHELGRAAIVVLPFNLLGIIPCWHSIFSDVRSLGFDILAFSYETSARANNAREEYYNNCGYENIKRHEISGLGVSFESDELYSWAYDANLIFDVMRKAGFASREIIKFDEIGIAYLGRVR